MSETSYYFHDDEALLDRLGTGLKKRRQMSGLSQIATCVTLVIAK
jgi:hypothetical protein